MYWRNYGTMSAFKERKDRMKTETENALRTIAQLDQEIKKDDLERAIRFLKGASGDQEPVIAVMKRKDVMDLLKIHRRTLDYYLEKGYLDRVYGGGKRAIGVSRDSFIRFTTRRVMSR